MSASPLESMAMRVAGILGLGKLRWSLRRLYVPVSGNALVLEVGAGGNPYPRVNILLDAYEETRERHWEPLVHDRPTVLAFGENLPFKDKAFDFVIAAHVLEHSPEPEKFLAELQRVARAGYIETPEAFMERVNPYKDHRLEVTMRDEGLVIRKKPAWIVDNELVDLYEWRAKRSMTGQLIPNNPFDFHVRYYWNDEIKYSVVNSDVDASWVPIEHEPAMHNSGGVKQRIRKMILNRLRQTFSQSKRNMLLDLLTYLRCPKCFASDFERQEKSLVCRNCHVRYFFDHDLLAMQPHEETKA